MAKKSKSTLSSEEANDSPDIFKVLFGLEAPEEEGLGLHTISTTTGIDDVKKKKKKKKPEKSDLDANLPETILEDSEKKRKKKKEEEVNAESGVESIDEEEARAKKTKRNKEVNPVSEVGLSAEDIESSVLVIGDVKEKRKKKRKKDEIETAYETKTYGSVPDAEAKKVGEKRKTMDEQPLAREGFDDEEKLLRTVFVGNLPLKLKKKLLLAEFSKFGEVDSVRIRSVPIVDSKTPRKGAIMKGKINESVDSVHAYIVFKDEKSAQASLSHNMAVVEGNHIRVDRACPPRKKLKGDSAPVYDNQRTVFVGNLPFDVKDEEIYQLFCGIDQVEANIEGVRVIRDPNSSVGKGIAYVLFKTREAANLVIRKRNLKIRDRSLRLYHAKSDATPSKKRNVPTTSAGTSSGKRFPVTPSGSHQDKSNSKIKSHLSYQGLKGSKSIQKKEGKNKDGFRPRSGEKRKQTPRTASPRSGEKRKQTPRTASGAEVKQRDKKRPAVAARKAKTLKGASGQTGVKRKPDNRTPDSFHRNKKARKMK